MIYRLRHLVVSERNSSTAVRKAPSSGEGEKEQRWCGTGCRSEPTSVTDEWSPWLVDLVTSRAAKSPFNLR